MSRELIVFLFYLAIVLSGEEVCLGFEPDFQIIYPFTTTSVFSFTLAQLCIFVVNVRLFVLEEGCRLVCLFKIIY